MIRLHRLAHLPPAQYGAEILQEKGVPVLIVEMGEGKPGKFHNRFPKIVINPKSVGVLTPIWLLFYATVYLCITILRNGKPRLIIAHGLFEQILGAVLSFFFRVPFAVHVHEIFDLRDLSFLNRLFLRAEPSILRRATFLIFPGEERRNIYVNRYSLRTRTFVVANCPRRRSLKVSSDYRKRLNIPDDAKILLYLGGVGDSNAILEAVTALRDHPNIHFVVAGWGDKQYYDRLIDCAVRFGIEPRLHLVGRIKEEKWDFLASADVCYTVYKPLAARLTCNATPSNKLMESLAVGRPVLAGITRDFATLIEKTQAGVYIDSTDPQTISRGLNRILEKLPEMGARAYLSHQTEYHYEIQFDKVLSAVFTFFPELHLAKDVGHKNS